MVGSTAVELTLPTHMNIHPTFHVSLVREYHRNTIVPPATNTPTIIEPRPETWITGKQETYSVDRVLDYRTRRVGKGRRKRVVHEFLAKWLGYSAEHNSWEPARNFTLEEIKRISQS